MPAERLQKILALAGHGSRRSCEQFILAGRVRVNGEVATLGQKADPSTDEIKLDGKPIALPLKQTYIALYKPRNVLSTVKKQPGDTRRTVRELVSIEGHLFPVGRLDFDSEGLILLTDDGDLANKLTHPRFEHQKEYKVLLASRPDNEQLETWRRGVVLRDGYRTAPADVHMLAYHGKGAWLRVVMHEGRKRQIRETSSLLGLSVVRIVRVRIGSLHLGSLKAGQWRELSPEEIRELKKNS
jgi:23S rRNA pseudouridine2605 synthase